MPAPEEILEELRKQHEALLEDVEETKTSGEFLPAVSRFISRCREAGRALALEDDRDYLRTMLDFWGNWVYNQTRSYPNTRLELPPDNVREEQISQRQTLITTTMQGPITSRLDTQPFSLPIVVGRVIPLWVWIVGVTAVGLIAVILLVVGLAVGPPEEEVEVVELSPTPQEPTRTPVPLPTETVAPTERPVSTTTPMPGVGGGPIEENLSASSILVQILQPENGTQFGPEQELVLLCAYDNFRAEWTLFFVLESVKTGVMRPIGERYVVPPEAQSGTREITVPVESIEPGSYLVGVLAATTPEVAEELAAAREGGLEEIPEGVVPFLRLIVIVVE